METTTSPLTFAASFPRDARFAPTVGELAAKLAQTTGCVEGVSLEIRAAVTAAFEAAIAADASDVSASIALALRADGPSFATEVTCGTQSYLHLTHPRSA
jgi:hypothetical protein